MGIERTRFPHSRRVQQAILEMRSFFLKVLY
jgi:hypothetical protein